MSPAPARPRAPSSGRDAVPWRTIWAVIASVLATGAALMLLRELHRVITWLLVALFFAVILTPAVDWLERRRMRRSLATVIVFFAGMAALGGLLYAFIRPVAERAQGFVNDLPGFVEDATEGRGPVGRLVQRYEIDRWVQEHQDSLQQALQNAATPAIDVARTVASTIFAILTILVLTFLMLLEGPRIADTAMRALPPARRHRVRLVAADVSKAVTGYVAGNLLISLVAGVATFVVLTIVGVPYAGVLALWVAFTDLIPLVGATLGAIPTIGFAFLHSPVAGFVALGFYIVYQQFENHFLQPAVMSRTVNLNPLAVLVSVLIGVELFGILGALLAIPVAGAVQTIVRDLYNERQGRFKEEPTVGADEVPVSGVTPQDPPEMSGEPPQPATEHQPEPA